MAFSTIEKRPLSFREWLEKQLEKVRSDPSPYPEYLQGKEHALEMVLDELEEYDETRLRHRG